MADEALKVTLESWTEILDKHQNYGSTLLQGFSREEGEFVNKYDAASAVLLNLVVSILLECYDFSVFIP